MPEKFQNAVITGHFGFVREETRAGKSRDYREVLVFEKLHFQNISVHTKTYSPRFHLLRFEEPFRKDSFS